MSPHLVPLPAARSEGSDGAWLWSEVRQFVTSLSHRMMVTTMMTRGAGAKIHKRLQSSEEWVWCRVRHLW